MPHESRPSLLRTFRRSINSWLLPQAVAKSKQLDLCILEDRVLYSATPLPTDVIQGIESEPSAVSNNQELQGEPILESGLVGTQGQGMFGASVEGSFRDLDRLLREYESEETILEENANQVAGADRIDSSDEAMHADQEAPRTAFFIDSSLEELEVLLESLNDSQADIFWLNPHSDGLQAITDVLAASSADYQSIHIVSHGAAGTIDFGSTQLSLSNLHLYGDSLAQWANHLTSEADILFYGCDVAAGASGQELLLSISALTGADIAASDDLTGYDMLGGNWILEYQIGNIAGESASILQSDTWEHVLATFVVTTTADENNGTGGLSLREAIIAANGNGQADTIILGTGTYTLSITGDGEGSAAQGDLDISSNITITGNGPVATIINATAMSDRVFEVTSSGSLSLAGLTVSGGVGGAYAGGAVYNNSGTLIATNVVFSGNTSLSADGGAIATSGTTTLDRVSLINNSATNGGAINVTGGTLSLTNVTVSGNSSTYDGGGIRADGGATTIRFSTFGDNAATSGNGGGIHRAAGTVSIASSVFGDNTSQYGGRDVNGAVTSAGYNIIENHSGFTPAGTDWTGTLSMPSVSVDATSGQSYYSISSGGLAQDGGNPTGAPSVDIHGNSRHGTPDIGSYELVNSAPVNTLPSNRYTNLDTAITFSNANGNAFQIADSDAASDAVQITLSQSNGILTFANTTGLTLGAGANGSSSMTYSGTVAAINAAFNAGIVFAPTVSFRGLAELTLTTNDLGNHGAGGAKSDTDKLRIHVGAVVVTNSSDSSNGSVGSITALMSSDGGDGISLREAILVSNATVGVDYVNFAIDTGIQQISLLSLLPTLTESIVLDAWTQPGFGGTPLIVIDANGASGDGFQITSTADYSIIRGFVLRDFAGDGIQIDAGADYNTIEGNYLGAFGAAGENLGVSEQNTGNGIRVEGNFNTIGGTTAQSRNVIGGNQLSGINLHNAENTLVHGNYIGITIDGSTIVGNTTGILISTGTSGSLIGTNADGVNDTTERNVISGNGTGIILEGSGTTANTVAGNYIGTDATGLLDRGNTNDGILIQNGAYGNSIGGTVNGEGNTIAFNGRDGVRIDSTAGIGNGVLGNSIHSNLGLDINLVGGTEDGYGVTANDPGDSDAGANSLQNFPVIANAHVSATGVSVSGSLNSTANRTFRIEVFVSAALDPSGHGPAERFLGSFEVTTDGSGDVAFDETLEGAVAEEGEFLTLTATDVTTNDTSELAAAMALVFTNSAPTILQTTTTSRGGLNLNNDGGNNAVLVADDGGAVLGGRSQLTIESQFSYTDATADMTLLSYAVGSGNGGNDVSLRLLGDGTLRFYVNGTFVSTSNFDYRLLADAQQHSLAVTWSNGAGDWQVFVDGVQRDSGSGLQSGATIQNGGTLVIGNDQDTEGGSYDPNQAFKGTLYDFRVFGDVRTSAEIASGYRSDIRNDEPGLLANWKFDDLSTSGVVIDAVSGNNLTQAQIPGGAFASSTTSLTMAIEENAHSGTIVGRVYGTDADREARIADLLATDSNLRYSSESDKFYKVVAGGFNWVAAKSNAESMTLEGIDGQLATVRSAAENSFITALAYSQTGGGSVWLGGTDATVEGAWRWLEGGVEADQFWSGTAAGYSTTSFTNWFSASQPNDLGGNEDALRLDSTSGRWFDAPTTGSLHNYVVQWNADSVLDVSEALIYTLQAQTVAGAFTIDASTGAISVADGSKLDYETQTSHTLTIRVHDGEFYHDQDFIISVNDQAVEAAFHLPGTQTTNEDVELIFSSASGNALTVSDQNGATNSPLQVRLSVPSGSLTLSQVTGLSIVEGANGTSGMVFYGTESDINAALDGLIFSPPAEFSGNISLSIETTLAANLQGWYTFDDSTANDESVGVAQNGVFHGDATTIDDATRGRVLSLDGSGDYVQIAGEFSQPQNATLAAWVNLNQKNVSGADVISIGDTLVLRADETGNGVVGMFYNGSTWVNISSARSIAGSGWHHLAFSFDDVNNQQRLYIDGELVAAGNHAESISYFNGDTYIGRHGSGSSSNWDFNGLIDDARVYTRALSANEIAALSRDQSAASGSLLIQVDSLNDAPVLSPYNPTLPLTEDGITFTAYVSSLLGSSVSDIDIGAVEGIAITDVTLSGGTLQYSLDGSDWLTVSGVSTTNALLLSATDQMRFTPSTTNGGITLFSFHAWDQTSGSAGGFSDASSTGGASAFSLAMNTVTVSVASVNDAPVLDSAGTMELESIAEDDSTPSGNTVSEIIASAGGDRISDVDIGALEGIAVISLSSGNGTWQFSLNGADWSNIVGVSDSSSLLLRSTDHIRFVPNGQTGTTASFEFRAWDQTTGAAGLQESTLSNGVMTAFSAATETASILVTDINDSPSVLLNTGATVAEGGAVVIDNSMLNEGDPDDLGVGVTYQLRFDLDGGTLLLDGMALKRSDTFTQADIDAGLVVYQHLGGEDPTETIRLQMADGGENGATTVNVDFELTITGSNDAPVAVSDPQGTAVNLSSDPDAVGFWRLGEVVGSIAIDSTANNFDGTYSGVALGSGGATGDGNTAAEFDGNSSYVDLGQLDVSGSGLTLSAWIYPDSFAVGDARIISKADGIDAADHTFMLSTMQVGSDYYLRLRISAGGHTETLIAHAGALTIGSWQHVAATYEAVSGQMTLYLNGHLVEQAIHSVGGPIDQDPTRSVWIGANPDSSKFFAGRIDEVALLSRALTADELASVAQVSPTEYSMLEDNSLSVAAINGVLHNDSDLDGDPLTAVLVSGPDNAAAFMLNPDGSFTYTPNAHFFGTDSFTYRAEDGTGQSQIATAVVTIVAVNDSPTVSDASLAAINEDTANSGSTLTSLFGSTFHDDDPGASLKGMLIVANAAPAGEGTWQYSTNGVNWYNVGSVNATTALALSDTSRLRFVPAANYNGVPTSLVLRALDNTYSQGFTIGSTRSTIDASSPAGSSPISSNTATLGVSVTPVNDAATMANLHGDILFYTEGDGTALLDQATAASVADIDSNDFSGGSLTVSIVSGADITEDVLSIHHQGTAAGEIGISGSDVTYGGVLIGSFSGGSAGVDLVVAFNSAATPEAASALVRNVMYENTDTVDASTTTRHIGFVIVDGDGATSIQSVVAVNVGATNNPPQISLPTGPLTYVENDLPTLLDPAATVTDGDSLDFFGGYIRATFSIGGSSQDQLSLRHEGTGPGQISLSGANVLYEGVVVGTRSGGTNGSQLNIALLATATPEAAQAIVRNLTYENSSDNPSASRTIVIAVSDGDGGVTSNNIVVNVTPVNDAGSIHNGFETFSGLFGGQAGRTDVGSAIYWSDSRLAVDSNATYQLNVTAVSGDGAGDNYDPSEIHYLGFVSFDSDGNAIEAIHVSRHSTAVDTTLAVDLLPGATQIVLSSAAGWNNSSDGLAASLAWYGYQNTDGDTYADYTYTRNVATNLWDAGAISGNVITLRNPWSGPSLMAGAAVRNATGSGGIYQFPLLNGASVPQISTNYAATIGGGEIINGSTSSTLFRPGTAYISPVVLANSLDTETEFAISNFSISASLGVTVFLENDGPISIVDSDVNLFDVDDSFTEAVTITLTNGKVGDTLWADEAAINLLGISVTGMPSGALLTDGSVTLTLTSDAANSVSLADYQTALSYISFNNESEDPDTTDRIVTLVMNDGDDDSLPNSLMIKVQASNDAPVQATIESSTIQYTENDGAIAITSTLTLSDVDDTHLESATVQIFANYANGQDVLTFTNQNGIVGTWNSTTGTLALSGHATKEDYQAALRSITYSNTSEVPSTAQRTLSFTVSDGSDFSTSVTRNLAITSINDDPTNTGSLPTSITVTEDVVSNVDLSAMNLSDLDALSGLLTVTLSADTGGYLFATTSGGVSVVNGGTDYVTLTGTLASLNAYFDNPASVRYRHPTLDINGDFLDLIYVSVRDNGNTGNGGGGDIGLGTIDVHVTPVNDAPVAATIEAVPLSYTENAGAVAITSTLTLADVDDTQLESAVVAITGNYVTGQDLLSFGSQNGITGSWNATTGELTLTGSATLAHYQAALRSITYSNTSDNPSTVTRTVSFTVDDGSLDSNTLSRDISLTPVNDAPVAATIEAAPLSYTENAGAVAITSTLTLADVDDTQLESAVVAITGNYVTGQDLLSFGSQNGITGSWNATTGELTLTGSATLAHYQAALRSIAYTNTSDNPSTVTRTVSFTVDDGSLDSNTLSRDISLTAVNDAPVAATIEAVPLSYTENAGAVAITSTLTLADVDDAQLESAVVAITGNYVTGQDLLSFGNQNGITGSWNATTGELTLTGSATLADYQTALRSITYSNTSDNPSTVTRTVSFTVDDGALDSNTLSRDIDLTAVNDAPVAATIEAVPLSYTENAGAVAITSTLTLADIDDTHMESAVVAITGNYVAGQDLLSFGSQNGITGSWNATTGELTLTGSATLAHYQTALRSIAYTNTSDNPSTVTRTVSFTVDDGSLDSNTLSRDISLTAVNDAPVAATIEAAPLSYTENAGAVAITSTLTLADVDDTQLESAVVAITGNYVTGQDLLSFVNQNGITGSWNATTGELTLTGSATLAHYQAALRSIAYSNTSDNPSTVTRTVSFTVDDGALDSNTLSRDIDLTAVNDEHLVTTNSGIVVIENSTTNSIGDTTLLTVDLDDAADELIYTLTAAPSYGALRLNGIALANGGTFSQDDINNGLLTYDHDGSETSSDEFSFSVDDASGADSQGIFSITITPVNDMPPEITSDGGGALATIAVVENSTLVTTVIAVDADVPSSTLVFHIAGGADSSLFAIDAISGQLTFVTSPDREAHSDADGDGIYEVSVEVSDGVRTDSQSISVSVVDVNEWNTTVAVDTDGTTNSVSENALVNTAVGITARALDGDATNNSITYLLTVNDDGLFQIDSATGVITTAVAIDRETHGASRLVEVEASSSDGSHSTQQFTVFIQDINEFAVSSASDIDGVANEVDESDPIGTSVGIVARAFDGDATNSTVTYRLHSNPQGLFQIDGLTGEVFTATMIDREGNGEFHTVTIEAMSSDGSSSLTDFSIRVVDVNEAPVTAADQFVVGYIDELYSAAPGVLANDWDPDGDALTVVVVVGPLVGTGSLGSDGTLYYRPVIGFIGQVSFQYYVTDGILNSEVSTVTIDVVLPTRILPPAPAGDAYGELNSRAEASETEIATEDVQSGVAVLGMVSGQTVESIVALREAEESGNTMAVASAQEYQLQPTRPELRIDDDTHVTSSSKFTIDIYEQELFQLRQSSIERLSLTGISTTPFVFDDVERNELESSSLDLFTYMDPIVATAVGTGLVIWLVHAGQIAAAVLSTASAWVQLDPLTVLQEVGVCDEADTSEEKMFDNDKANRPSGDS